jgi:hypothetical protein
LLSEAAPLGLEASSGTGRKDPSYNEYNDSREGNSGVKNEYQEWDQTFILKP